MKYLTFLLLYISCLLLSCDKYENTRDDLKGELYLRGRIFLHDDIEGSEVKPLGGKQIMIGYSSDNTNNYLFNVKADSLGYFLFENLRENTSYVIFGEYSDSTGKYTARLDTTMSNSIDSLRLTFTPTMKHNGIIYYVTDSLGAPLSNVSICLFTSSIVINDSCAGSTYQLTTNTFGMASKLNIPVSNYYNFFKAKYGGLTLTAIDTILNLGKESIIRDTIVVHR